MPKLTVIAVLFNPIRWRSRWNLFEDFVKHMTAAGVALVVVECAFGERPFRFTEKGNWQHVQVRTWDELWIKENLFNLGVQRAETDYIAFLDGDIHFTRNDWAEETVEQLQHYMVVQPWSYAVYQNHLHGATTSHTSFCYDWVTDGAGIYKLDRGTATATRHRPVHHRHPPYDHPRDEAADVVVPAAPGEPDYRFHPGLAWAWRREALDAVGGLIECDVLGGGDLHMAQSLIGDYGKTFTRYGTADPREVSQGYRTVVERWQDRCEAFVKRDVGYCDGTIMHNWHGPMWARFYNHKWAIVINNKYDPNIHIKHNSQGVLEWTHLVTPQFRDDVRSYMRIRREDAET